MMQAHNTASSSSQPSSPPLPLELETLIQTKTLRSRAKELFLSYLSLAIQKEGPHAFGSLIIHLDYPYYTLFQFDPHQTFSPELYYFLFYLFELFSIGVQFHASTMISWISGILLPQRYSSPSNERDVQRKKKFLEWFNPLS